jgi:hypothetical protein
MDGRSVTSLHSGGRAERQLQALDRMTCCLHRGEGRLEAMARRYGKMGQLLIRLDYSSRASPLYVLNRR